jgi:nucleoid DNA-binding protein
MALPKLNETLNMTMVIPSTKKKVKFRPYLVKEEKVLLQAFESQNLQLILDTMCDTIESCLDPQSNVNVSDLATFDVEYMFTQIRSASVGENSTILVKCKECETENPIKIDLSELEVEINEVDNVIDITDDISVEMRYPTYHGIAAPGAELDENSAESIMNIVASSIAAVMTEEERIDVSNEDPAEVKDFLDSLTSTQFQKLSAFLQDMPSLSHTAEFECKECKAENSVTLKGLADFF